VHLLFFQTQPNVPQVITVPNVQISKSSVVGGKVGFAVVGGEVVGGEVVGGDVVGGEVVGGGVVGSEVVGGEVGDTLGNDVGASDG